MIIDWRQGISTFNARVHHFGFGFNWVYFVDYVAPAAGGGAGELSRRRRR